tara:strand:- start:1607 stop:2239 length:633 start_codon:yes stop_codon:yes gene_type:complete
MRIERKFVFDNKFQLESCFKKLYKSFIFKKIYEPREISTIYLDTKNLDYLYDNLAGINNRIKSRLRFYSNMNNKVIYEEKIKKNELGSKTKITLNLNGNKKLGFKSTLNTLKKTNFYLNSKSFLNETLFVKYKRQYFSDIFGNFITIDSEIRFSDVTYFRKLISYNKSLIEYKIDETNYKNNMFYNFPQKYTRHSKYVVGMALLNKTSYV